MTNRSLFLAIVILCLANGLLSPAFGLLIATAPYWAPDIIWQTETMDLRRFALFHMASFLVAFATFAVSGVPAALYERMKRPHSERVSLLIWLSGAILLAIPAGMRFS